MSLSKIPHRFREILLISSKIPSSLAHFGRLLFAQIRSYPGKLVGVFSVLALAASALILTPGTRDAAAQASDPRDGLTPFTCTGDFYQVHDSPTSTVSRVDLVNGNFSSLGDTGENLRATGLHPDTGIAYAMQDQNPLLGNVLFAMGSDSSTVELGTVTIDATTDLQNRNYASGDFGPGNLFYIRSNGNNRPLVAIDVDTLSVVQQYSPTGLTTNPNTADFAFNPVDGSFYAVEGNAANARLLRFTLDDNPANPTFEVTSVGSTGIQTNGNGGNNIFGAMYADSAGNIFGIQNRTGRMYQFDVTDGTPVLVGQAASAG